VVTFGIGLAITVAATATGLLWVGQADAPTRSGSATMNGPGEQTTGAQTAGAQTAGTQTTAAQATAAAATTAAVSLGPSPASPTTSATPPPKSSVPATTTTRKPAATTKKAAAPKPSTASAGDESSVEQQVVTLVNQERARVGCHALSVNPILVTVARDHSKDMAVNNYFDHNSPDGRTPFQRMSDAGYKYSTAAENIAAGQTTAAAVMDAWMNSAGHRANILNCDLQQLGVGRYDRQGSKYGVYWTQDFGTPR
jgi:uncharacterized protein YkwD